MEELSGAQRNTLATFRTRLEDILSPKHDDFCLIRWLKARNWNINKAEKMFRDSMKWRQKTGADTVLQDWEKPEVIQKYYPGGLFGFDKEGNPIWIETLGRSDPKGLLHSAKKAQFIKYKIHSCELIYKTLDEQAEKLGAKERGLIIIFDLDKYGMKHLWKPAVDLYCDILTMYEANYPETLKRCYVINAPKIFPIAYSLVKQFLSEETKMKIQILGSNWKEKLLEAIDPDQLPVHWGGTATDPDGDNYCRSKVCMGGEVPKSYYLTETSEDLEHLTQLSVGRAAMHQLEENISEPGSILMWQFTSEGKDIGFGIFLKTSIKKQKISEMKEIVPIERVNSHMVPEDGSLVLDAIGTYVIVFDNSYSWMSSKKVNYDIKVVPPSNMKEMEAVGSGDPLVRSTSNMEPVTGYDSSVIDITIQRSETGYVITRDSKETYRNGVAMDGLNNLVELKPTNNSVVAINGENTSPEIVKSCPNPQVGVVKENEICAIRNVRESSDFETDDEGATCV